MKELLLFIAGMCFIAYVMPMVDAFSTWIVHLFNTKIVDEQVKGERMKNSLEVDEGPKQAIGFSIDSPRYFEEDEEEEE